MFHEVWELEAFQTAKVTFKGIGNGAYQE